MQNADSLTNPSAAKNAVMHARTKSKPRKKCTPPLVQPADAKQKFLSNPEKIALFIAANALQK